MTYQIYAPPKHGDKARVSMVLNDLYRKWPNRVLRLFRRYRFYYDTGQGFCEHVTWERRPGKMIPNNS